MKVPHSQRRIGIGFRTDAERRLCSKGGAFKNARRSADVVEQARGTRESLVAHQVLVIEPPRRIAKDSVSLRRQFSQRMVVGHFEALHRWLMNRAEAFKNR